MYVQGVGQGHGGSHEYRVDQVERPRNEHEGELQRLGDPREERGQTRREHDASNDLLLARFRLVPDGQSRRGESEHHDREEAGHEDARAGIAGEEPGEVTVGAVVVAQDEPHNRVENVVQAEWNQQSVQDAVDSRAQNRIAAHGGADRGEALVEERVEQGEHHGDHQCGQRGQDRHETAPAEEAQPVGQFGPVESLPQQGRRQTDHDAAQDAVIDLRLLSGGRGGAAVQHHRRHDLEDVGHHQVADDGRERRRAVALLGETEGNSDGEEQRQPVEQGRTGGTDHLCGRGNGRELSEKIILPQPLENRGRRKGRDRKHEAPAKALENFHGVAVTLGPRRGSGRGGSV